MILDMQVHLWEADRPDRPWVAGRSPSLPQPFGPDDILPLMDEAGVDRVVIVPPGIMGFNNDYGLECAARWPDRFAVMGLIDPLRPDISEVIAGWRSQPGMLGIRTHLSAPFREKWPSPDALEPFWAACAEHGVPVAAFVPGAVSIADGVAERHPALKFIIDHLGLPQIDHGFDYPEFPAVLKLARHPNVVVKLSTLASRSLTGYPFRETHEMIRQAYDAFGPRRLLWGTDHTQQLARHRGRYVEEVDLIRKAVDFLTDEERRWILGENAAAYLGWPAGVPSPSL